MVDGSDPDIVRPKNTPAVENKTDSNMTIGWEMLLN
jgi:hypothetical protein